MPLIILQYVHDPMPMEMNVVTLIMVKMLAVTMTILPVMVLMFGEWELKVCLSTGLLADLLRATPPRLRMDVPAHMGTAGCLNWMHEEGMRVVLQPRRCWRLARRQWQWKSRQRVGARAYHHALNWPLAYRG
jgi:hypothetical protein